MTETLWRIITFYGPQEISVANAQNWECLSSLFIQVPKRLILVWIRMICQVRIISFKASSLHPIHPSTKCSPWVPRALILKWVRLCVTLFGQWTMLGEYPLMFESATSWLGEKTCITVTDVTGVKSQLSSQPNWSLLRAEWEWLLWLPTNGPLSQHTNSQLQWKHPTWKPRKQSKDRGTNRY